MKKFTLAICLVIAWALPASAMLYVFDGAGKCIERNMVYPEPPLSAFQANHGTVYLAHYDTDPNPGLDLSSITATISGGQVTNVAFQPPAQVFLHVAISGGDGDTPPGIPSDGSQALTITATLTATEDPGSPVIPLDGSWRIVIRDSAGGEYDVVRVTMTAGQVSASYNGNARAGTCSIKQGDFIPVEVGGVTYQVVLVGSPQFKVYRVL